MKTDYLYAIENILPIKKLRRVILAVTYNCNSRCKTCSIWKKKYKDELDIEDFKKFSESEIFRKLKFLILTGGEPFMRNDIDEIVNLFKKKNPNLHITILTNGLLSSTIFQKVKNMPKDTLITMSLNGDEKAHDETRGINGNFKSLTKTIGLLKELNQNINFIFTVTKENYDKLSWAWDFAKKQNINIMFSPEMDYSRLNTEKNRGLNENQKIKVLGQLKQIYSERKRPFFDDTYFWFFNKYYKNKTITNICYAGTNSIYIDYAGDVYPCENLVGKTKPLGNLKEEFKLPKGYMKKIKESKCYEGCYLLCEMVRNMRKHPIKTIIEKEK